MPRKTVRTGAIGKHKGIGMDVGFSVWKPADEGPVKINFDPSKGKIKATFILDFGKTDLDSCQASGIVRTIVGYLRKSLDVKLEHFS